jgi:hypothetical protein
MTKPTAKEITAIAALTQTRRSNLALELAAVLDRFQDLENHDALPVLLGLAAKVAKDAGCPNAIEFALTAEHAYAATEEALENVGERGP